MKGPCKLVLTDEGKVSILHIKLVKAIGSRSIANQVYAIYKATKIDTAMDSAGYVRDKHGEHTVENVMAFMNVADMITQISEDNAVISLSEGFTDRLGVLIDFIDPIDTLNKCQKFNETHPNKVAYMTLFGNKFRITVDDRNSLNQHYVTETSTALRLWSAYVTTLQSKLGINLPAVMSNIDNLNPLTILKFLKYLNTAIKLPINSLSLTDIKNILAIRSQDMVVLNLISRMGSLDDAVLRVYTAIHSPSSLASTDVGFAINALTLATTWKVSPIAINTVIEKNTVGTRSTEEIQLLDITDTIDKLHKAFKINIQNLKRTEGTEIKTLLDAAIDAILSLNRLILLIRERQGITPTGKAIENQLKTLLEKVELKKCYEGLLSFLTNASSLLEKINEKIKTLPSNPDNWQDALEKSRITIQARNAYDSYASIVDAMLNIDRLSISEDLDDTDKANLKALADKMIIQLRDCNNGIKSLETDTMTDIATMVLGDKTDPLTIANLVKSSCEDSSMLDYLYSVGDASNPLIASMGTIIRDALKQRDAKLSKIALRIRRATDKLRKDSGKKNGVDTSFMYDSFGHLLNRDYDIRWDVFFAVRRDAKKKFKKEGLEGFDLQEAMDKWEEDNTLEVVVDTVSGRTERIPSMDYAVTETIRGKVSIINTYNTLSKELLDYYDTMMLIKGELGTLLPYYAQRHLNAPLLRKSSLDVISSWMKGKTSLKKATMLILDRMAWWRIREDDTNYAKNGYIDELTGENYVYGRSNFSNNKFELIPIFYINNLKNKEDLLMDFSAALLSFASTAINYEAMDNIRDTVETLSDYISTQAIGTSKGGHTVQDAVSNGTTMVSRTINKKSNSSTTSLLVQGFVELHIYGHKLKESQDKLGWRLLRGMIAYSSLKTLAANFKGAISNYVVGNILNWIEAISGTFMELGGKETEFITIKDYLWAIKHMTGLGLGDTFTSLEDFFTNNQNSEISVLMDRFNPTLDLNGNLTYLRYHSSIGRMLLGGFNAFGMYASGEFLIHNSMIYARLHHIKTKKGGQTYTLLDALKKVKVDGNTHLEIDTSFTLEDGSAITDAFLDKIRDAIQYINQNNHGAMNEEDKGLIHQYVLGRAVMNLRLWMVKHYSRRYRGKHWDAAKKEWTTGYYTEMYKLIRDTIQDEKTFMTALAAHWKDMDLSLRQNAARCASELSMFAILSLLSLGLGDPKDHKGDYWYRMLIWQVKRAWTDELNSMPIGVTQEITSMLDLLSLMAVIKTINGTLYIFMGLGDIFEETLTKNGKENKYWHNVKKYSIPFYSHILLLFDFDENDNYFSVFNSGRNR